MPRERRTKKQVAELDQALFEVVDEIRPATVRQTFYQAVVRGLVPKDQTKGYDVVQRRLVYLRESGAIPYGWITDNARLVHSLNAHSSLEAYAAEVAERYRRDYWSEASERVEIWLEKDALAGVLRGTVVGGWGVDLYVTRGFPSVTYLQDAADQINEIRKPTYIYLLTDLDPSGMSIAETVERELLRRTGDQGRIAPWAMVWRIAINPMQVANMGLPTHDVNPNDKRTAGFVETYGTQAAELDAIPPNTLRQLVSDCIERHMDTDYLRSLQLAEQQERDVLRAIYQEAG